MKQDYNNTLNLPVTEFPMRGNLPQREPEMLNDWEDKKLYYKLIEKNKDKTKYILHDGPPYANGDIHLGTSLNKVLKDIIVKHKHMTGFNAVYVCGWDCHGLPIELKAIKEFGTENALDRVQIRKQCREFALSCLDNQKKQFKRLGVWGDYDNPYLTLTKEYEAAQIEVFGEMAKRGFIYKGLKPVYWCPECQTALAEAEIEYADDSCHSIYVKFNITDDKGKFANYGIDLNKASIVIWTTTTWTLPGNLAICLGPDFEYNFVRIDDESSASNGEYLLMAKGLTEAVMAASKIEKYTQIGSFTGKELEFIETQHPFLDRKSIVIVGDHVTLESGTGCVHTAPGHGHEDFEICNSYKTFEIVVPVDAKGKMTSEAGEFEGLSTSDANKAIAKKLEETNNLLAIQKINHQYPHCWRCHDPIIYRATEQWFCSIDGFKEQTMQAIKDVKWYPAWGEDRISSMVNDRSDWCISRQRTWGVPIPMLYCNDCGKYLVNDTTIKAVSDLFRREGSDAWYEKDLKEFIPEDVKCECGCNNFTKEMDIMDVWFDSGCSHKAVLCERDDLQWPADLYLEGIDQFRGWFQSSLLTSVATTGKAPYKAVCSHGWVVDGEGKKMSKSLGNTILPQDIIKEFGADVLRLWVSSLDYHNDVRVSKEMLKQLSEAYRKIRNTARFILGNLTNGNKFNPDLDMVEIKNLSELDKWALNRLNNLIDKVTASYEELDFYLVYHAVHNFCVVDMSNYYLDIIKDRLYCEKEDSQDRRAAQTAIYIILDAVTKMIAPILSYTADEIWKHIPHKSSDDLNSVIFNDYPEKINLDIDEIFIEKWNKIYNLREEVKKAQELKRAEGVIGASLEAKITIFGDDEFLKFTKDLSQVLKSVFIVSDVVISKGEKFEIIVEKAEGDKCERCWTYSKFVSGNEDVLCERCANTVK